MRWMTVTGFALAVALAAAPTDATATLVQIDDRTDTINVLVDGIPQGPVSESFGVGFATTAIPGIFTGVNVGFEILEPGQSAISDLMALLVTPNPAPNNTTTVRITFFSDTDGQALTVPPDFPPIEVITETGDFQTIYTDSNGDFSLTIQFASDVPEPGTLSLLAAGLLGLGAIRLRRKPRSRTA